MEVHRILGHGFSEIGYKDAMMIESILRDLEVTRESEFKINYKNRILSHSFFADFIFFKEIIVEVKASEGAINNDYISQILNYLKASKCSKGLIINFGRKSLDYKRVIF